MDVGIDDRVDAGTDGQRDVRMGLRPALGAGRYEEEVEFLERLLLSLV
jgi:hypothetical protein